MVLSESPKIQAFNMDCMEFMKDKPDNFYDLAIVDPPYGIKRDGQEESRSVINNSRHGKHKYFESKGWDCIKPSESYFDDLYRISVNQIIWGANYYPKHLNPSRGWVFWDKMQRGFNSDGELAYTSFNRALSVIGIQRGVLAKEGTIHPTQKPVKLYRWLLTNYAKEGDKILDTHGGSFSSAIACHMEGFDLDICELDGDYFNDAVKRFKLNTIQERLF